MIIKNGKNIGAIYKGNKVIGAIYKGVKLVWEAVQKILLSGIPPLRLAKCDGTDLVNYKIDGNSVQGRLPNEYQEVEYIEEKRTSTNYAYIDTGVIPNANTGVDIVYKAINCTESQYILGVRESSISYAVNGSSSRTDWDIRFNGVAVYSEIERTADKWRSKITMSNGAGTWELTNLDVGTSKTINFSGKKVTATLPLGLFYYNYEATNPTAYTHHNLRVYSCKIYDGTTLIRDFIPCHRKSDDEIGMYDLVNNVFYSNANTGDFTQGTSTITQDTPIEIESVGDTVFPKEYQEVEYIESTGTQYIDTGLLLTQNHSLEMLISHFDTTGNSRTFGSRSSATSNNFSVVSGPVGGVMSIVTDFYNYSKNRLSYVIDGDELLNISISNKKLKINNSEKEVSTYEEFTTPSNAYLFNCSGSYPAGYVNAKMRLYSCKIYENDILVRNFIPCYRKSDKKIGLYDLANNVFYSNIGTGEFIKGNDKNLYKIPVKLSNGTEDITTNIYLTEPLRKCGEYADYIDFENKKVVRKIGVYTYNGTETWVKHATTTDGYGVFRNENLLTPLINAPLNATFMTHFNLCYKAATADFALNEYRFAWSGNTNIGSTRVYISAKETTVEDFATWLSENKASIYYPLATPTEETIELPNIPTFKGTTILSVDTNIQPSSVEVLYLKGIVEPG